MNTYFNLNSAQKVLLEYSINTYGYCPVNVSRAVGPRCVDRAINNLSNDKEICALQFATKNNFLSFMVLEILRFYELSRDTNARSHWFRI